jgi:hypothetical protein
MGYDFTMFHVEHSIMNRVEKAFIFRCFYGSCDALNPLRTKPLKQMKRVAIVEFGEDVVPEK